MRCYPVLFKHGRVVHACVTKWKSMQDFQFDQMFGGGMTILCGKKCEGDAHILSRCPIQHTAKKHKVTCMRCLAKIKKDDCEIGALR